MRNGKTKSFLAVLISLALICSTLTIRPVTAYAAEEGEEYGDPMTLQVNMVDCDDFGNASVSVYRQEDSQSQKEYIGYYCVDDDEGGAVFDYIRGDILTFYVYDPPESLIQNSTLYYIYNNFYDVSFGKGTDPMGYSDCYTFTINTASSLIIDTIMILYSYAQVEDYLAHYTASNQYCFMTADSMVPAYYGPDEYGEYNHYDSQYPRYTTFNGQIKLFIYDVFQNLVYSVNDYSHVSGLIIDGTEYSMDVLEALNYCSWNGSYLVFDMSVMMPALADNGKEDPKAVTISPVYSYSESTYGEFLLDFHAGADEHTYADIIQEIADGVVTASTSFTIRDWDENKQCRVTYRDGESVILRIGNLPQNYDVDYIRMYVIKDNGSVTYANPLSCENGILEFRLDYFLYPNECPKIYIAYTMEQAEYYSMTEYVTGDRADYPGCYVLEYGKGIDLVSHSTNAYVSKGVLDGNTRLLIETHNRSSSITLSSELGDLTDYWNLVVYGKTANDSNYEDTIRMSQNSRGFTSVGTSSVTIDLWKLELNYLDISEAQDQSVIGNCRVEIVKKENTDSDSYKLAFQVNNGSAYRKLADGTRESTGNGTLEYQFGEAEYLTMTLGDLISENETYLKTLEVLSDWQATPAGWVFLGAYEGDERIEKSEIMDLNELLDQDLKDLIDTWGESNGDTQELYLKLVWSSEGTLQVEFIPNGHRYYIRSDSGYYDYSSSSAYDLTFEAPVNGISMFAHDPYWSSVEPVNPQGFLGWYLCVQDTASDGTKSYRQVDSHLYSTEDIQNYVPRLQYGNHVYFVSQWDTETRIQSVSATVDDMIDMNFFLTIPDAASTVVMNGPEGEVTKTVSQLSRIESSLYKAVYEIPPACMDDEMTVTVLDSDGEIIWLANESAREDGSFSYTLREYLMEAANADTVKMEKLILAMSTYGLYAQDYFGIETEDELPALSEIDESVWTSSSLQAAETGELSGSLQYYGTSLILQNGIRLRHYFTENPGTVKLGPKLGGISVEPVSTGSFWYVETPKISLADIGNKMLYAVNIGDWKLSYSVLSYCSKAVLMQSAASEVSKALYLYYQALNIYSVCDHSETYHVFVGEDSHATYCLNCGRKLGEGTCTDFRDSDGICSACGSSEDAYAFDGMSVISKTIQGREVDATHKNHIYEGDRVTISESWTYPENENVFYWKTRVIMTLPDGTQVDLMEEDLDEVDVLATSSGSYDGGTKGQVSVTFYAEQELDGSDIQVEVYGYNEALSADSNVSYLEKIQSERRTIHVEDALTMGFLENLTETLYFVQNEIGTTLTARAYAPGNLSYQWQIYTEGTEFDNTDDGTDEVETDTEDAEATDSEDSDSEGSDSEESDTEEDETASGYWKNIQGANSSSYYLGNIKSERIGQRYRCVIQNENKILISNECVLGYHSRVQVRSLRELLNFSAGETSFTLKITNVPTAKVLSLALIDGTVYDSHEAAGLITIEKTSGIDPANPVFRVYDYTFRLSEEAQRMNLTGASITIGTTSFQCAEDESEPCNGMHTFSVLIN